MKNNWSESEYRITVFASIFPTCIILLIIVVGVIMYFLVPMVDPIDNSINKNREIVKHLIVKDSAHNGFRLVYATKKAVTKDRLEEISNRPHVKETFIRIQADAPGYFGSLLYTDIYDLAVFALKYEVDKEIMIHNIFVTGVDKCNLYIGENPKIADPAEYFDYGTEQGVLYINFQDINAYSKNKKRIYRYWKCFGINAMSDTDEQFSHFSESERIR